MITTAYFGPRSYPEQNRVVGDFVSSIIWGDTGRVRDYCSMAVMEDGRLIAGTLFHNYYSEQGVIELTSASLSRRWLTRGVIRSMFALPFDRLGCQIVALRVSSKNYGMLRIARSFGFSEVLIPRLRGRTEDEHVFTYTDDQWKSSRYNRVNLPDAE